MGSCCCCHIQRYDFKVAAAQGSRTARFDNINTTGNVDNSHGMRQLHSKSSPIVQSNDIQANSPERNSSSHRKPVSNSVTYETKTTNDNVRDSSKLGKTNGTSRCINNGNSSPIIEKIESVKRCSVKDADLSPETASCDTISEASSHSDLGSDLDSERPSIIYNNIPETLPMSRQTSQGCSSVDDDYKDYQSSERSTGVRFSDVNCHFSGISSDDDEDFGAEEEDTFPVIGRIQRTIPGKVRGKPYQASRLGRAISRSTSQDAQEFIHWKKGNRLGRGSFGTVFLGLTSTGELIAVKQVELIETDYEEAEKEYAKIYQEVALLKALSHRNIVGYMGSNYESGVISIFMEYIAGGSLMSVLDKFGPLEEPVIRRYTLQLLDAVAYLHDNHVVHRDIKSANIMLVPDGTVKLIDFGCAKRLALRLSRSGSHLQMSLRGTPYWMAPEVINETGHGKKSDIWSLGCTIFEMFTGKPPWGDREPLAAIYAIGSEDFAVPTLPEEGFSEEIRGFVKLFMIRDKRKRPNAKDLLKHPFLTSSDSLPSSPNRL